MPKESIYIGKFTGMVGSADQRDLPPGAAIFGKNLNAVTTMGTFEGLPLDAEQGASTSIASSQFGKFADENGDEIAVYVNTLDNTLRTADTLTGTPAENSSLGSKTIQDSSGRYAIASDGGAAHLGYGAYDLDSSETNAPSWVGTIRHQQFRAGTTGSVTAQTAYLKRADCVGCYPSEDTSTITFPTRVQDATTGQYSYINDQNRFHLGRTYVWYASLVYDGYQEGPPRVIQSIFLTKESILITDGYGQSTDTSPTLANETTDWQTTTNATNAQSTISDPATGVKQIEFTFRVRTASGDSAARPALPRRITGINIYRSEVEGFWSASPYLNTDLLPALTEPTHLAFIDINDSNWASAGAGGGSNVFNNSADTFREYVFTDDYDGGDLTFEDRTGYSHNLEDMRMSWGLSAASEGFHIVGNCWHPRLKEVYTWLFRSKPYRFDTFDWANDYLVLPTKPLALQMFGGRLYAFSEGRTYVINVGTFDIEDTWEGIGCEHPKSIVVSDEGMFWAGAKNIYLHDGSRVRVVGTPVLKNAYQATAGYDGKDTTHHPICCYHPTYNSFIVWYNKTSAFHGLMYTPSTNTWVYLSPPTNLTSSMNGVLYRPNGEPLFFVTGSSNSHVYEIFGDSSLRSWDWVGYDMANPGVKEVYYHAYVGHEGSTPSVEFFENDPTYGSAAAWSSTSSPSTGVTKGKINAGTWNYSRHFALRVYGTGSQKASSFSIVRRRVDGVNRAIDGAR